MEAVDRRIAELKMQKMCCSQIVLSVVGLEPQEKENPDMVKAMRGLCYGLQTQQACGALSGAVCALSMYDFDADALREVCIELTEWFESEIGGPSCEKILGLGGRPTAICGKAIAETIYKSLEILKEHGYIPEDYMEE